MPRTDVYAFDPSQPVRESLHDAIVAIVGDMLVADESRYRSMGIHWTFPALPTGLQFASVRDYVSELVEHEIDGAVYEAFNAWKVEHQLKS